MQIAAPDAVTTGGAALPAIPNLRDAGGVPAGHGRTVRPGRLFRSVDLSRAEDADLAGLAGLGVRTVFDLRTAVERESAPDRLPAGAVDRHLDVFRDFQRASAANLREIIFDPDLVERFVRGGRARGFMLESYQAMVTLPSAHESYRELLRGLGAGGPVLVHCTTGKDRTGWAVALTLLLLGVDESAVYADYLRTNDDLVPLLEPVFAGFEAGGGSRADLLPLLSVRAEYLDAARERVARDHGDVHAYANTALGLTDDDLAALAAALLR